jgi:hypothetical protein
MSTEEGAASNLEPEQGRGRWHPHAASFDFPETDSAEDATTAKDEEEIARILDLFDQMTESAERAAERLDRMHEDVRDMIADIRQARGAAILERAAA